MESWKQGRSALFEQLENVYSKIGESIAAELNNDKFARISTEELRILRETSASVQKLAESHGRLTDELEASREAVARVGELEKENKRLAHELQTKWNRDYPKNGNSSSRIQHPRSSGRPSSVAGTAPGETKQTTREEYDDLAKKHDKLCQKFDAMKGAKELAEEKAKDEKAKNQDWNAWAKNMEEKARKKDARIRKLKEKLQDLESKVGSQEENSGEESTSERQPETVTNTQIVLPPMPGIVDEQVQVPASSSLPKHPQPGSAAGISHERVNGRHGCPAESEMELPPLPDEEKNIGDAGLQPLEAHHTSSTEGEPDTGLPETTAGGDSVADHESENDESNIPVFVCTRSVKKRKARDKNVDETPGPKIKLEVIEISSPHTPVAGYINASESMDLDDIGEKDCTPRKAHKVAMVSRHISRLMANSQSSSRSRSQSQAHSNTSATSAPVSHVTPDRPALQTRSVNSKILPRTSDDTGKASKKRKRASDHAVAEWTENGEVNPVNRGLLKSKPNSQVLSPPQSRNIVRPSTSILSAIQKQTSKVTTASTVALAQELFGITPHKQLEPAISNMGKSNVSRDPTPNPRPSPRRASREPADSTALPSKPHVPSPLEATRPFSDQVPRSSAESSTPSSHDPSIPDEGAPGRSPSPFPGTQLPARRDLASAFISRTTLELAKASPRTPIIGRPGRPSRSAHAQKKQIQTEGDFEMDPSQEPLRARPVSKLSLNDFKINPTYNQGYDFAYTEVVRGKEARAGLQGCTKPDCCGPQFRGLAKAELEIRRPTLSQEERDEMLLEEYLGTGAQRIKSMGAAEREEILIQAKTRQLANKYGRHRHTYDKETSPTGFWRTDFPTTQEELEDREAEKGQVRELVQQRYRQAMRSGGAYIFRDE